MTVPVEAARLEVFPASNAKEPPMFSAILVPVDGSEHAKKACQQHIAAGIEIEI